MNSVTIVMYHYVRPIEKSKYPRIKGLEIAGFSRQLDFLYSNFNFVTAEEVICAALMGSSLPEKSCLLTFDDGYADHYYYVLPELLKRKIQGSFFPPVQPVTERTMLDVNSIHFILATSSDTSILVKDIYNACREIGISDEEIKFYRDTYAIASRFDSKEVIYVKRMLQHALPETARNSITSFLFEKHVKVKQSEFADSLYMSEKEVRDLVNSGMYVGSHGLKHLWLNKETPISQKNEIEQSLNFLKIVGARTRDWIMCYPYGAYNGDTLNILMGLNCAVGITTQVSKADLSFHHRLQLPRFDTNDFPQ
jgi:peptidoglycan/xylan/chitin deacetylase (PgdA/CDA1 family)